MNNEPLARFNLGKLSDLKLEINNKWPKHRKGYTIFFSLELPI